MKNSTAIKVCFIATNSFALFKQGCSTLFGGMEVRASLFAKEMAKDDNYEVSFIVHDKKLISSEVLNNITFYNCLLDWNSSQQKDLLKEIDADFYINFGAHRISANAVKFCHQLNKFSILFLASDLDLSKIYYRNSRHHNIYGALGHICYFPIHYANVVFTQTIDQQKLLQSRFTKNGFLIKNPVPLDIDKIDHVLNTADEYVLWVGKASILPKRPDLCIELALKCSEVNFLMIMNQNDVEAYYKMAESAAENVQIIERVAYEDMVAVYSKAKIFISTSDFEGLPNSFLQSGQYRAPILSLNVDPDGMLNEYGNGMCFNGDLKSMSEKISELWQDSITCWEIGEKLFSYIEENHSLAHLIVHF